MVVGTGQATNEEEKFSVEEQQTEIRPQSKGVKRKADWSQAMMEALYDWDASTEEEKLEVMGESVARNSWSAAPPRLTWHNPAEGGGMADSSGVKLFDKLGAETGPTKPEELSAEDYYASLEMSSFFPTFMQPEKREKFMLRRAMEKDLDFDFRRLNFLRQTNSESVKNSAEVLSENQDAKKDSAIAGAASAVDRPQLPPLVSIEEEPEEEEEEPHPPKTAATKAPPDTADSSSSTVKSGASNELKTQSASSQSSVASGGPKPQQRELLVDDQKPQSSAATQDNLKPLSAISTDNSQKPHSATTEKSQSSADERQKPQSGAPNDSDDRLSGGPIPQSPHIAATTPKEITEQLLDHAFKKAPDEFAKAEGEGNEGNNFGTNLTKKASQKSDLFLSHNSSNRLGGHSRSSINMNCEYTGYKSKETFREKRLRAIKSSRVPVVESESRAATANGTPIISDPYSAICLRDVMKDDDSRVYPWISDCVADHGTEEDLRKVKKELESRAVPFPSDVRRYSLMLALRHRYADAIAVLNPSINVGRWSLLIVFDY
jgi:hypothetical protein